MNAVPGNRLIQVDRSTEHNLKCGYTLKWKIDA